METNSDYINSRLCRFRRWNCALVVGWALIASSVSFENAFAIKADSPEVKQLVASGLKALEQPLKEMDDSNAQRLGAKCLVGLAFIKGKKPDHPAVEAAFKACRDNMTNGKPIDVYSNGLAIVFLCEAGAKKHQREIQWYLDLLHKRQKDQGGWGYDGNNPDQSNYQTGDTSQTQYATLGYWEAYRNGFRIDANSLAGVANWLVRTQDPHGCWGYQGTVPSGSQPVEQSLTGPSMLAAGLASTLICADLLDAVPPPETDSLSDELRDENGNLPPALRVAGVDPAAPAAPVSKIHTERVDSGDLLRAIDHAITWMKANYSVEIGKYTYYYLYATERYQSFHELLEGQTEDEPQWYTDGYEYLLAHKKEFGGWEGGCGRTVDTAFAVLFLSRSTQKSIKGTLGEGSLTGGRGIPANVSRAKMRGNQIVVEQVQTKIDDMLSMVDDGEQSKLDELARDPTALVVDKVDEKSARRLQQLVRGGEPQVRLLAVRALGRTGNLDYVPTLIFALTDPEPRIVLEARDALRFTSRRFDGFGPPDDFTEKQRFEAVDAWKNWYRSLRPGAMPDR